MASAQIMRFIKGKIPWGSLESMVFFALPEPFLIAAFPALSCTFSGLMECCPVSALPVDEL
jgi:hypothetical protein